MSISPLSFRRAPRLAIASFCFAAATFFTWLSFAVPTPPSGMLTPGTILTYTTGPNLRSNPTAQLGAAGMGLICDGTFPCEDYALTVNVPAGYEATHNMVITTSWPLAAEDYDVYLLQAGVVTKASASSSNPEVITAEAVAGSYVVRIVPFAVAGGTTTTKIELRDKPTTPPPPPPSSGTPRYQNFPAPGNMGNSSGEPTLATGKPIAGQPGGRTMYIAGLETLRVTWDDCPSPAKPLWEDRSFVTTSATTLDPILFGDVDISRIFVSQLGPKTSSLVYTDNEGGSGPTPLPGDYTQTQGSGLNSGVDHQTIGGGPFRPGLPDGTLPLGYANAVYYASQDIAVAQAALSRDGGLTFGPAVPMYNLTQCGGLHGHVKVTPRSPASEANGHVGTFYLPNKGCGGQQAVVVSEDEGLTFVVRPVPGSSPGNTDPSVGIDTDGKIYFAFADGDGHPKVSVSADKGVTWTPTPIDVGIPFGLKNSVFATAVGGSSGRATVMYLATDTGGSPEAINSFTGIWHIYAASTFDGGASWTTVRVTPENDPVQRGSLCTSGTTCGADRNLLDFNDMEIDHEGRIIMAYADGCFGCTDPKGSDSRSAKATIARQSGGKRMLAAFDPNPAEPAAPKAPRVDSVVRDNGGIVHVDWTEPDNGGSPITGYNVFRKEGPGGTYVRLGGGTPPTVPADKTNYDDVTAAPSAQYFYKVTALNAINEGSFCGEFPVGLPAAVESPCALPGLTILTDPTGDSAVGQQGLPQHDIQRISIAEPFYPDGSQKLVFTIKVANLNPPPPNTTYPLFFTAPDGLGYYVGMRTSAPATPLAPRFEYGTVPITAGAYGAPVYVGNADSESNYNADGTITIAVPRNKFGPTPNGPAIGSVLNKFLLRVRIDPGLTPDNCPDDLGPAGNYTVAGNAFCRPNAAPIAGLSATPRTGNAPLTVNFDASGSADPDAGDTVVSYTFNFGDGSGLVSSSPMVSHPYNDSGVFNATVRVTDSRDKISTNTASTVISVGSLLLSVDSVKTHASQGVFAINLPADGSGIECRTGGANGNYTIVFTFTNPVTAVDSAVVDEGSATKTGNAVGPNSNQYTVSLTNVTNVQRVGVKLDGVHVNGATLTNVRGRMGVLIGDTNADTRVNIVDTNQTKSRAGQPTDSTNFRSDVNLLDGAINSGDTFIVRANSGTALPVAPDSAERKDKK